MAPKSYSLKLLTTAGLMALFAALPPAGASDAAKPASEQVRYRPLDEILKEANRKSATGATRVEVETWLASEMRKSGLELDRPSQPKAPAAVQSAPAWDVYGRQRLPSGPAPGDQVPGSPADNAPESLPINGLPRPAPSETYPLNDQEEAFHSRGCRYPSCHDSDGDPANGNRGNQERRDFSVWFAA